MYLLILLMTYVSAIYEYNLSVRPDYDRDIARKKASAIFYKFDIQHAKVLSTISFVRSRVDPGDNQVVDPSFPQPNMVFAGSQAECTANTMCNNKKYHDTTLFFKQGTNYIPVYLRPECPLCVFCDGKTNRCMVDNDGDGILESPGPSSEDCDYINGSWYQKIMLTNEESLYDETEMASKLLCLDNKLYEDPHDCESTKDEYGNLIDSCCNGTDAGRAYKVLVSYKRVDPRWLNRITNGIAMDFWRAIESRPFYTNIGIVQWDEDKDKWIFRGKTSLFAAYHEKYDAWKAEEEQKMLEDSTYVEKAVPKYIKHVTEWELPSNVFDEDFFVDLRGNDMCKENGCIFRLNEF